MHTASYPKLRLYLGSVACTGLGSKGPSAKQSTGYACSAEELVKFHCEDPVYKEVHSCRRDSLSASNERGSLAKEGCHKR